MEFGADVAGAGFGSSAATASAETSRVPVPPRDIFTAQFVWCTLERLHSQLMLLNANASAASWVGILSAL